MHNVTVLAGLLPFLIVSKKQILNF